MRVLITGCNGQLGRELLRSRPQKCDVTAVDLEEADISRVEDVTSLVCGLKPQLVLNAAAYTAVDQAESQREQAFKVNGAGAGHLAKAARDSGARMVHVSTDFVFDGTASKPYRPEDPVGPINTYGASKLEGEQRVINALPDRSVIIRTSWLYSAYGRNFVKTMLRLMKERDHITIVADQIGSPTWAKTLSTAIWVAGFKSELTGILHWCDAGRATWYDFAVAIRDEAAQAGVLDRSVRIDPIDTSAYPTPAQRPRYSVLDTSRARETLKIQPLEWRMALRQMLREYTLLREEA